MILNVRVFCPGPCSVQLEHERLIALVGRLPEPYELFVLPLVLGRYPAVIEPLREG